ncbi:MAG: hypothetical protein KAX55_16020, partial [Propionivibrio sp.]|nr:hypothetical protein [Propionivibrio sp.]
RWPGGVHQSDSGGRATAVIKVGTQLSERDDRSLFSSTHTIGQIPSARLTPTRSLSELRADARNLYAAKLLTPKAVRGYDKVALRDQKQL